MTQYLRAGGFDKGSLFWGNYAGFGSLYTASYDPSDVGYLPNSGNSVTGRATLCDYVYRGLPVRLIVNSPAARGDSSDPVEAARSTRTTITRVPLLYTKPKVEVVSGTPAFKTQKILAGRALMSDSYAKPQHAAGSATPGDAISTHKDGYNVLYGDGSAKWFGDPQQRIMWWNTPDDYSGYATMIGFDKTSLCEFYASAPTFHYVYNVTGWYPVPTGPKYKESSWHAVWHQFDADSGIDNVPYPGIVP
jgi:prepilin-type processing-associated H-X9-DG protein